MIILTLQSNGSWPSLKKSYHLTCCENVHKPSCIQLLLGSLDVKDGDKTTWKKISDYKKKFALL